MSTLPSVRKPEVSEAVQERKAVTMEHATPFTMNAESAENHEFIISSKMVTKDEIMLTNKNGKVDNVLQNIIVDSASRKTLRENEIVPGTAKESDIGIEETMEKVVFDIT